MDPFQEAGPSHSHSQPHHDSQDMAAAPGAGRKRVGFTAEAPRPFSITSPDKPDTGSGGHNTPLQRPDLTQDDLLELGESLQLALEKEYPHKPLPPVVLPRDVQKPRPAIRKDPRTPPPEFYLNDQPNPFEDEAERQSSLHSNLKERSGLDAQRRAAKLSKSVGTYSAPVSRRNSKELLSPPVELRNMARTYDTIADASDDEDDPQFMKRASMLLRQHTVRATAQESLNSEDLYHTDVPLRSGQVTPDTLEVEDERVSRPTKYRTGVLGTLLRASSTAQGSASAGRFGDRPGHLRDLSAGTLSGASTAANSPNSSPPTSGYNTPRGGRPWFRNQSNASTTSISQLVGSSAHSFATPAQKELGHEAGEQYKRSRPALGKRTKSDESVFGMRKAKRRDDEIKIKIHL
jgi:hypothetical protein